MCRVPCAVCLLALLPLAVSAQYYNQGAAPASLRWSQLRGEHHRVIFPTPYERQAVRLMHYLDTLHAVIGHDYRYGALELPVVVQTHNFASNGLVMRAPTRMELIVPPPAAMTPEPWLKQLAAHELRHAVQYNNADRHVIRALSYVLGDQATLVGVAQFPIWALEGDAVLAETQTATFGRGLQPSFTLRYRALLADPAYKRLATDKWFSGSYKDFMPDHYAVGYQIVSFARTRYGENIWDRVADFSARRPYLILTAQVALRKYYGTSVRGLLRATMGDLAAFWDSLPAVEASGRRVATPITSYTTYSSPLVAGGRVVAVKSDLDRPERLVAISPSGERELLRMGIPNSPLAYDPSRGRIYWSELRRSKLWGQRVNSQLVYTEFDGFSKPRPRLVRGARQVLFPTPAENGAVAYVHYDYSGQYSIRLLGGGVVAAFEPPVSLHGLAYDAGNYYFLAVGERGMWIGSVDARGRVGTIRQPGYSTLSDLRTAGGRLYFTSTYSGRDEAHAWDAATAREWQLTASHYGSFAPAPLGDSLLTATYSAEGYLLAKHPAARTREVPQESLPRNVVNPPRAQWASDFNIDRVHVADTTAREIRRYRKLPHALNLHSWAPASFDALGVTAGSESADDITAGVTLISQNLLSTTTLAARWGVRGGASLWEMGLEYGGLPVKFSLAMEAGGGYQRVYGASMLASLPPLKEHFRLETRARLPILFDRGAHIRLLQPALDYEYYNALLFKSDSTFTRGLHKLVGTLYWADEARLAHRDFLPRWGYALSASVAVNPADDRFSTLWGLLGRAYLPGLAPHHSLQLRAAVQGQSEGAYHFSQKLLFPKGAEWGVAPQRYRAAALDYALPLACPDRGIPSLIYLKRVRLNVAGYYARYQPFRSREWREAWSWGGDVSLDVNLLRTPASATNTLGFSLYRPSDRRGVFAGFFYTLPI